METHKIEGLDLTIVLATLNEIDNLPGLVSSLDLILGKRGLKYQFLFVDDNSSDGTKEFITNYCNENKFSKYIFSNYKESTLIARYRGIKNADGRYIIIMDADFQHPPEYVTDIYDNLLKGYDIVIASRYIKGGSTGNRKPVRGIISRIASELAKFSLNTSRHITDPVSCYIGLRSDLSLDINNKWRGYEIGIFLRASNPYAKIKEIPYKFAERENGSSKVTSSINFIRIYLIELLLAKKLESKRRVVLTSNNVETQKKTY